MAGSGRIQKGRGKYPQVAVNDGEHTRGGWKMHVQAGEKTAHPPDLRPSIPRVSLAFSLANGWNAPYFSFGRTARVPFNALSFLQYPKAILLSLSDPKCRNSRLIPSAGRFQRDSPLPTFPLFLFPVPLLPTVAASE